MPEGFNHLLYVSNTVNETTCINLYWEEKGWGGVGLAS